MGKAVRYYLRFDDDVVSRPVCGVAASIERAVTKTALPALQDIDLTVPRRLDDERYDLDVGQRVFVEVALANMMAFDFHEIDSMPGAI